MKTKELKENAAGVALAAFGVAAGLWVYNSGLPTIKKWLN